MNNHIIHFETLGCRLNQDETEGAARSFADAGFTVDLEPLTANTAVNEDTILGVVNTCTVTGKAEQKARRIIRLVLEKCPHAVVIVTGCYAELDGIEIRAICPDRIAIIPGTKKYLLAKIAQSLSTIENCINGDRISLTVNDIAKATDEQNKKSLNAFTLYTPVFEKHSRASIKVEDGCNNACAFCRIHLARGKAVSLPVAEVLARVQLLEEQGMNEVVFTGVNMSQYAGTVSAKDAARFQPGTTPTDHIASFAELLDTLIQNTKFIKFRIASYYPQCIDEKLCEVIKSPRVQPSFHLSIQSGSDRILKLMNRPYTAATVLHAITMLRSAKENPFIACDIIAGFPGETEEDFEATKTLCNAAHFSWIHAFPFSPRPGTPAATMTPKIPERIKDERVSWLTECAVQGKLAYINSFKEKPLSAIVENSRSQRTALGTTLGGAQIVHVVTENFLQVECPCTGNSPIPGSVVTVNVTGTLEANIRSGKEIEASGEIK